ncbi:MAG: PASTA domain-containing protein [Candidatus Azobacteroides sp.]|nr:PASTA domain-containing protein [Candidatus Azobacteroides sp.]
MEKRSLLKNIFVRNLLGLILVSVLLIGAILLGLNRYTRHGKAVEVPDVRGLSAEKAKSFFTEKNLNFAVVDSIFYKSATPGSILETTPPVGSKVKEGRTIYLKIAAFLPQLIAIPDVKDSSQRQSMAMLRSLGFENVEVKSVPGAYMDLVVGIESRGIALEAGQRVPANTPLSLLVSSGSDDILFLEDPTDSVETSSDDSLF